MKRGKTKTPTYCDELAPRYQLGLPGGSEFDALTTGFARAAGEAKANQLTVALNAARAQNKRAASAGYSEAATRANLQLISDHAKSGGWMLADMNTGIARSVTSKSLFDEFGAEVNQNFAKPGEVLTADTFSKGHAWNRVVHAGYKAPPLSGPFEKVFEQTVKLRDGLFLAHMPAVDAGIKAALSTPVRTFNPQFFTPSPIKFPQGLRGLGSP